MWSMEWVWLMMLVMLMMSMLNNLVKVLSYLMFLEVIFIQSILSMTLFMDGQAGEDLILILLVMAAVGATIGLTLLVMNALSDDHKDYMKWCCIAY